MANVIRPKSVSSENKKKEEEAPVELTPILDGAEVEDDSLPDEEEDVEAIEPIAPTRLEDADPQAELWDNGPTVGEVLAYRNEHGGVFITSFDMDDHYLWKVIKRKEYKSVLRRIEDLQNTQEYSPAELNMIQEEMITELCLLIPDPAKVNFDDLPAGIPSLLSQQILESSGFVAFDTREL